MKSYSDFLEKIGSFGKFQKTACFLMILSIVPNGYLVMCSVFTQTVPEHYCNISEVETWRIMKNLSLNSDEYRQKLMSYIPNKFDETQKIVFNNCLRYEAAYTNSSATIQCDNGWIYNSEPELITIANEWDIVCENAWQRPMCTSLFLAGELVGSFISGFLADKFGRRPVFLGGTFGMFVFVLLLAFSVNVYMYMAVNLICGLFCFLNNITAFVLATELIDINKRAAIGSSQAFGSAIGSLILPAAAYFIRDWRLLLKTFALSGILFIPYYWWLPESPRWLLTSGRTKQALKVIRKIAKVNGKNLQEVDISLESIPLNENGERIGGEQSLTYLDLFVNKCLRQRMLIMIFIWFSVSIVYYTIGLNTSNLGGNKYINCAIAAAVELPASFFSYLCIEKIGRRNTTLGFFLVGGLFCGVAPLFLLVNHKVMVAFTMVAKLVISANFSLIHIYCVELFPTLLRNSSIGTASTFARFGGIIAPYLIYAGLEVSIYIPFVLNGFVGVLSALAVIGLPETRGIRLPENVDDAMKLEK